MKLYAAPLQGFTEAPWRNLHQEVFGGIDAYYTPFVRMEKGEFRNKDVREIASENNTVSRLIPQLIASTPAELERLAGLFIEKGYKEADINMGCPFPLMTGKHKGSGILPYPAEVEALLKELVHYPELGFSVKMRLGWECADEWRPLLPLLNAAPCGGSFCILVSGSNSTRERWTWLRSPLSMRSAPIRWCITVTC